MKLFGPVHLYVAFCINGAESVIASPSHTAVGAVTVGVEGLGFTTTLIAARGLSQSFSVCET